MPSYFAGEEVSAVNVDTPELLQAVWWVCDRIKIFCKSGRGNKVVNFAVVSDNVGNDVLDGDVVGHIAVMGSDFRNATCVGY